MQPLAHNLNNTTLVPSLSIGSAGGTCSEHDIKYIHNFDHVFRVDWPKIISLLFFLQPAHQVPSSPLRVQVCACSVHPTAAPHLKPPPSACAATATTAAMQTSRTSPAPVSSFPHASQHVPQSTCCSSKQRRTRVLRLVMNTSSDSRTW